MSSLSGRVYHPANTKYGGIGLIRSKLAIDLSKHFLFSKGEEYSPTHFLWNQNTVKLDFDWIKETIRKDEKNL